MPRSPRVLSTRPSSGFNSKAAEIRRRLSADRPDDPEALDALADAERRLAIFYAEQRNTSRASSPCSLAVLAAREHLAQASDPTMSRDSSSPRPTTTSALFMSTPTARPRPRPTTGKPCGCLFPGRCPSPSVAMYRSETWPCIPTSTSARSTTTRAGVPRPRRLTVGPWRVQKKAGPRLPHRAEIHQERFCRTAEELGSIADPYASTTRPRPRTSKWSTCGSAWPAGGPIRSPRWPRPAGTRGTPSS